MKHLNVNQQYYDPAQWSRAVLGFSLVLVFLWISIAMSWIWEDEGKITNAELGTPLVMANHYYIKEQQQ